MTFWKTFWAAVLGSLLTAIIGLGLFFLIIKITLAGFTEMFETKPLVVEENTVLHMKLNGPIGDYSYANVNKNTFQFSQQFGLMEILDGLEIAKKDEKIKGIFLNCDNLSAGMATTKEIRDALIDFKSSGKFVVAYAENYSNKSYYLSSAADEIYVFPSGMMEFLGLGIERMFLKGALENLDVQMQIIRGSNNKFKSAVEPLMLEGMSEASRLQTQTYLDAMWATMTSEISESRDIPVAELNEIADSVFIRQSGDALDYEMADSITYYDEVLQILRKKAGTKEEDDLALLSFKKYAMRKTHHERTLGKLEDKNLAVIFAEGEIVDGYSEPGTIGGYTLSSQIRDAREDENIKAVVLRINSPGGSALASDIIWREVILTKAIKPVVVSMGDVAASGGYYIACAADKIYAQPNTITGSIGVFGIIPYTGDMFKNKLGITFDRVQTNQHSVLSLNRKLTDEELLIVQDGVDDIYDDFISKVAKGRGMKKSEVDSIGQGRVWAGTNAMDIGLIDAYGGIYDAVFDAANRAGISADSISIKFYPTADESPLSNMLQNIDELENMQLSLQPQSELEIQLMEIYNYIKSVSTRKSYQMRMEYLYWIE